MARDDTGDDDDALEEELVCGAVALFEAALEDEARGGEGEAEEDEEGEEGIFGVVRYLPNKEGGAEARSEGGGGW